MKTLTIQVPDELDAEVAAWQDGQPYVLNVTQTAPLKFTLDSTGAQEETPGEEEPAAPAKVPPTVRALADEE